MQPGGDRGDRRVGFLVVGSPRSGTTLVQRLASEIPGVRMPPETHFFPTMVDDILQNEPFPLDEARLRTALAAYGALPINYGLAVDADRIVETLGGKCDSFMDLFNALVIQLAGPGRMWGEKTPAHLMWWRPLSKADDSLKFIVVIRDPRAVVSSNIGAPWADAEWTRPWEHQKHLLFAYGWLNEEIAAWRLQRSLGARVLTLRYESVVADPDQCRQAIASFLGLPLSQGPTEAPENMILPWESWKQRALEPVDVGRSTSWQRDGRLSPAAAEEVTALCSFGILRRRYHLDPPWVTARALARLAPRQRDLRGLRAYEVGRRTRIEGKTL